MVFELSLWDYSRTAGFEEMQLKVGQLLLSQNLDLDLHLFLQYMMY